MNKPTPGWVKSNPLEAVTKEYRKSIIGIDINGENHKGIITAELRYFEDVLLLKIYKQATNRMGYICFDLDQFEKELHEKHLRFQNLIYVLITRGFNVAKDTGIREIEDDSASIMIYWDSTVYSYDISKYGNRLTPVHYFDKFSRTLSKIEAELSKSSSKELLSGSEKSCMWVDLYDTIEQIKEKIIERFPTAKKFHFHHPYTTSPDEFKHEDWTLADYGVEQSDELTIEFMVDEDE